MKTVGLLRDGGREIRQNPRSAGSLGIRSGEHLLAYLRDGRSFGVGVRRAVWIRVRNDEVSTFRWPTMSSSYNRRRPPSSTMKTRTGFGFPRISMSRSVSRSLSSPSPTPSVITTTPSIRSSSYVPRTISTDSATASIKAVSESVEGSSPFTLSITCSSVPCPTPPTLRRVSLRLRTRRGRSGRDPSGHRGNRGVPRGCHRAQHPCLRTCRWRSLRRQIVSASAIPVEQPQGPFHRGHRVGQCPGGAGRDQSVRRRSPRRTQGDPQVVHEPTAEYVGGLHMRGITAVGAWDDAPVVGDERSVAWVDRLKVTVPGFHAGMGLASS